MALLDEQRLTVASLTASKIGQLIGASGYIYASFIDINASLRMYARLANAQTASADESLGLLLSDEQKMVGMHLTGLSSASESSMRHSLRRVEESSDERPRRIGGDTSEISGACCVCSSCDPWPFLP